MQVRIVLARAGKAHRRITRKTVIGRIELRMLAGEDEDRRQSAAAERLGDRLELDRLGTRADDQNDATGQPSP